MNKNAMFMLSYGLFVLTAKEGSKDNGCIINTVFQVTSEPERIVFTVNKSNYTHDMIIRTGMANVSILTEQSVFETYRHWGYQSGADINKTKDMTFQRSDNGLIYLVNETNAFISAEIKSTTDLGTHTLFLADVSQKSVLSDETSVTYDYYQNHIKPATGYAVTSDSSNLKGYICTVCGYIYEGETLPVSFVCPLCGHPASDFIPL